MGGTLDRWYHISLFNVTIISLKRIINLSEITGLTIEWTKHLSILLLSDLNESDNQFNDVDIPTFRRGVRIEDGKVYLTTI